MLSNERLPVNSRRQGAGLIPRIALSSCSARLLTCHPPDRLAVPASSERGYEHVKKYALTLTPSPSPLTRERGFSSGFALLAPSPLGGEGRVRGVCIEALIFSQVLPGLLFYMLRRAPPPGQNDKAWFAGYPPIDHRLWQQPPGTGVVICTEFLRPPARVIRAWRNRRPGSKKNKSRKICLTKIEGRDRMDSFNSLVGNPGKLCRTRSRLQSHGIRLARGAARKSFRTSSMQRACAITAGK